jgi:hypothetical protein
MLPPFPFCAVPPLDGPRAWRQHQDHKLWILRRWRDAAERRLAALDAAISTLEKQMERDQSRGES